MDRAREWQGANADTMMARTSAPEALREQLRQSLRRMIAGRHQERADEMMLRLALREVCERARREGMRVEQLLILLKRTWRELPETLREARHDSEAALGRVATACINEYFLDGGAREARPEAHGEKREG